MDKVNLIHADAIEGMRSLKDNSVDLVVTDPPYNLSKNYGETQDDLEFNEYLTFTENWLKEVDRVLKPHGTIYICMGMRFISYMYVILEQKIKYNFVSWITWHYTQGIGKTKGYSARHDDILMFSKNKNFVFNIDAIRIPQKFYRSINNMRGANPGNVWKFSHVHYCSTNRQQHPTQKPEALFERMILASSNERDTVLDPFIGSGTSARVCQQLNRNIIGIDINKNYIEMTKERLQKHFYGFDSIDERLIRIPNDLNNVRIREEYVKNHINWFLKNNKNQIDNFMSKYALKYSAKNKTKEKQNINFSFFDFRS